METGKIEKKPFADFIEDSGVTVIVSFYCFSHSENYLVHFWVWLQPFVLRLHFGSRLSMLLHSCPFAYQPSFCCIRQSKSKYESPSQWQIKQTTIEWEVNCIVQIELKNGAFGNLFRRVVISIRLFFIFVVLSIKHLLLYSSPSNICLFHFFAYVFFYLLQFFVLIKQLQIACLRFVFVLAYKTQTQTEWVCGFFLQ